MTTMHVTKAKLHKFVKQAGDSVTTLLTDFGSWAAVITVDGQDYKVETESTNPIGDATIIPVSREHADKAMRTDYRTRTYW